ncbi:oxidized low-density lipoprotein receptor 1 [Chrysemys picta bellii]|uniref:oxidized low-density lipoprotein receptor 1 n=1 Tax=Chrysemys picta bellii TaxID=8478 RepID=UPI0032B2E18E
MAEVTYADLKFMTREQPRNQEPHEAKAKDSPTPSPYWRPAAVILGIFCFGLLVTAGVLSVKWKSLDAAIDKHGDMVFYFQGHRCSPCPDNWLQHGENCYFLSTKWKTWQESKALCSSLDSRLLKIESKEELGFIISSAQSYSSYSFWIALSRKGADGSWLWEDGTAFSTDLFWIPEASSSLYPICVSIQGANVNAAACGSYKFCICEKVANSVGTA